MTLSTIWEKGRISAFAVASMLNLGLFLSVYVPLNVYGTQYGTPLFLFEWERKIPLIPSMIIPYLSFNLLFVVPFLVLPTQAIRRAGVAFALTTICAGGIFLLFPVQNAFPHTTPPGLFAPLFSWLYTVDLPSNMFPSLHVAYSILFLLFSFPYIRNRSFQVAFVSWVVIVVIATIFTHQHHLIDVIGGLFLAGICWVFSEQLIASCIHRE